MTSLWLGGLSAVCTLCLVLAHHLYTYWKRKGIPSVYAFPPFGCLGPVVRQTKCFAAVIRDIHLNCKEPLLGVYALYRPLLLVCDPELVKRILITDSDHFPDRGFPYDEKNDPMGAHLFVMTSPKWRRLRAKFSPTFTSGKLKNMFPIVVQKTHLMMTFLDELPGSSNELRIKDILGYTTVSVLAEIFFGFELNAFIDTDHEFVKMGKQFFDPVTLPDRAKAVAMFCFPQLFPILKLNFFPDYVNRYCMYLVKSVMDLRKSDTSLCRNDFIQTLINLMKDSQSEGDEKLTIEMCTAQTFLFYGAGFETSASTASYCLYELSKCPEWMDKVRNEIDELMAKRDGKILYEDLVELRNLDKSLKETLRIYPALGILNRECSKDYKVPGMDIVIEKGTPVIISNWGLQMDEKAFPNPEIFDPSRFSGDTDNLHYYPLGGGPRYCIGARLGIMIVQVQLCYFIHHFKFTAIDSELIFKTQSPLLLDSNGVRMNVQRRSCASKH